MSKHIHKFMVLALILLALPIGVFAQQQTTPQAQTSNTRGTLVAGKLQEVGEGFIIVAGQRINTANAQSPTNLVTGTWVEVQLAAANRDELIAERVSYPQRTELTLIGAVESVNPDSLKIAGMNFNTRQAKFDDDRLVVGSKVEVDFIQREGQAYAIKVDVDDDHNAAVNINPRLIGIINTLEDGKLTIGGMSFDLSSADVQANLFEGAFVVLDFTYNNNTLTPVHVGFYDDDHLEVHGYIEAVDANTLTVNGMVFDITRAEIDSDDGLAVGDYVEVEYIITDAGLVALEVDEDDDRDWDDWDDWDDFDDDDNNAPCIPARPEGWHTYRIRPGDTLSGIASASGTNLQQLIAVNCIINPSVVVVGATLYVQNPINAPVQPTPSHDGYIGDHDDDNDDNDDHDDDDRGHNPQPTQPPHDDDDDDRGDHDDDDDRGDNDNDD